MPIPAKAICAQTHPLPLCTHIDNKNSWPSQVLSEVYLMLGGHDDDHVKLQTYVHTQRHDDRFMTENSRIVSLPEFTFILVIFK